MLVYIPAGHIVVEAVLGSMQAVGLHAQAAIKSRAACDSFEALVSRMKPDKATGAKKDAIDFMTGFSNSMSHM